MSFNRRPDRRPSGPRSGGFRPERRDFDRSSGPGRPDRPDRGAAPRADRPPYRDDRGERDARPPYRDDRGERDARGFAPRGDRPPFRDEGGMSLRLDPRHLGQLKRFAGDVGMRPGELAMQWIVERLDAELGRPSPPSPDLAARLEELSTRVAALEDSLAATASATASEDVDGAEAPPVAEPELTHVAPPEAPDDAVADEAELEPAPPAEAEVPKPRRARASAPAPRGERVGLHDEIIAVIEERGPMPAAELAAEIAARGRYVAPRSGKPLDAAAVSSRVSNPAYRERFTRSDGRIGLADRS